MTCPIVRRTVGFELASIRPAHFAATKILGSNDGSAGDPIPCVLFRCSCGGVLRDKVPEERCLGDPPLLRLESEASHAYLFTLLDLRAGGPDADTRVPGIASQLTALCVANLQRFKRVSPSDGAAAQGLTSPGTPSAAGTAYNFPQSVQICCRGPGSSPRACLRIVAHPSKVRMYILRGWSPSGLTGRNALRS